MIEKYNVQGENQKYAKKNCFCKSLCTTNIYSIITKNIKSQISFKLNNQQNAGRYVFPNTHTQEENSSNRQICLKITYRNVRYVVYLEFQVFQDF